MTAHRGDYLDDLNPAQLEAVRHGDGPLLILAGAGSGKTRVLTYRIACLLDEFGVAPRHILAVTFTNKAADEMRRRVLSLVGPSVEAAWMGTFHSMSARILRREARWGWWTPGFSIYDAADQLDLVKDCMQSLGLSTTTFAPKAVLSEISRAKDRLLSADAYSGRAGGRFEGAVARTYVEYEKRLIENNAFDFDDLIMGAVVLLRKHAPVLDVYARRFEHVLVDEYQDTSHAQYALVNLLSSHHRNVCVVGDDDQSIYGWRGADITNILDFEKDHPDAKVIRLEQNYRSTDSILDAAHDVVSNNTRRREKKLWTDRRGGRAVRLFRLMNEYEEADGIRDAIVEGIRGAGREPRDFAVLYRTHAQSRVIENSLRRAGIAYDIVGGVRFYERAEVKDMLAYLRVLANPADAVSLKRIINVPPRKIGDRTIERLEAHVAERGVPLLDAVAAGGRGEISGVAPAARSALSEFSGLFARLRGKLDETAIDALLAELLESTGYVEWLERSKSENAAQRVANVEELVSAVSEFVEATEEAGLGEFLEQVSLVAGIDDWEDEANAVSLMTLHNAKGLEFTAVIIPGLEDGLLPHESSFEDDEELEEERRLLYVGMTRAKDELLLMTCDTRRRGGMMSVRAPSRFLDEISRDHLEIESVSTAAPVSRSRPRRRRPRDVFPDYESYSQEERGLSPGTRVMHPRWGEGVVLDVSGIAGDAVALIRFADEIEKRVMVKYAKLEIVDRG